LVSKADSSCDDRGLVLIQIDALSRKELENAFTAGCTPFLKKLIDVQSYDLHSHYSGMPCSTAAVQGELLYGDKSCVPAFSFFDREIKRIFTIFNPRDALEIGDSWLARLASDHRPSLTEIKMKRKH
jgi:hypothetical protein